MHFAGAGCKGVGKVAYVYNNDTMFFISRLQEEHVVLILEFCY